MKIALSEISYGQEEIQEVMDSLRSGNVTMGSKCRRFEALFAEYVGTKHAVFVNSGSSANLLAMFTLFNPQCNASSGNGLPQGSEVIVPAVAWSTTIWPIVQAGGIPVLVDCDPRTLTLSTEALHGALSDKTAAVCVVHPLGNVCDMDAIVRFCDDNNLLLIEDTCEALGSTYKNTFAGTFGIVGTYSFYFSHHMTTIEGGMVVTDDDDLDALLKCLRSHGWSRDTSRKGPIPFEDRYRFINSGFNLRPTELNAAFGIHQISKLDAFNTQRIAMTLALKERLKKFADAGFMSFMETDSGIKAAYFGFPILTQSKKTRDRLADFLDSQNIETRPVICGNMARQPAMAFTKHRVPEPLTGADRIMDCGLYFGMHPSFTQDHVDYIAAVFERFDWS